MRRMFNDVWMNDKFTHIKVNDNFKITTLQQMVNGNILTKNKQNNSINGIIVIGNKKCFYKVQEIKSYFMELQGYYQMYSKFPISIVAIGIPKERKVSRLYFTPTFSFSGSHAAAIR